MFHSSQFSILINLTLPFLISPSTMRLLFWTMPPVILNPPPVILNLIQDLFDPHPPNYQLLTTNYLIP